MKKCINCENLKIDIEKTGYAAARCLIKNPPKAGKIITWANTVFETYGDAVMGINGELGGNRIILELQKKKKAPYWCPLLAK